MPHVRLVMLKFLKFQIARFPILLRHENQIIQLKQRILTAFGLRVLRKLLVHTCKDMGSSTVARSFVALWSLRLANFLWSWVPPKPFHISILADSCSTISLSHLRLYQTRREHFYGRSDHSTSIPSPSGHPFSDPHSERLVIQSYGFGIQSFVFNQPFRSNGKQTFETHRVFSNICGFDSPDEFYSIGQGAEMCKHI